MKNNTDASKSLDLQELRGYSNPPEVESVLLLIKNLFELREYKKCSHLLKEYRLRYPDNQSVIFYYYYSLWMNGLIRKEEEIYENCKHPLI